MRRTARVSGAHRSPLNRIIKPEVRLLSSARAAEPPQQQASDENS